MTRVRIVTLAGDPEREASLSALLGPRLDVELVLRCVDRIEALAAIRGASLNAVVAIGNPHWFDRQEAEEATEAGVKLIALVDHPFDAERMRGLGAVLLPLSATDDQIVAACRKDSVHGRPVQRTSSASGTNKVVAVWGAKGSPGRTAVAIELAHLLADRQPSTLLMDADTYGGDILQLLGITEELPTLVWAARMAAKGETDPARFLADLRRAHDAGPALLPGIPRADLWSEISDFGMKELLKKVREIFAFNICDVGGCFEPSSSPYPEEGEGRNRVARVCLREADRVVTVVRCDPVGIKNFLWTFEDLKELVDPDRIWVVANRVLPGEERDVADLLRRYIRKNAIAFVPDGGDLAAGLKPVAEALGGRPTATGILSRLAGRRDA
ncbi:MAG TPA: P-loop NTPase [Actinomycetota bacterium]|nr:P-loop NTPase [Actinomycetota bacterium]